MNIEIEIKSPDARNDIYELRNYLQANVPDIQLNIKEQAPQEGQMSIALAIAHFVLNCVLHVAGHLTVEEMYDRYLKPKIKQWLAMRKNHRMGVVEVGTTLKGNKSKTYFLEDSEGQSKVYDNLRYAIDTDKTRAVLVGVSEFDTGFSSIPPVKGNMEDFFQLLTDKKHIGLSPENVAVSFNKTNTEIEELLLKTSRLPDTDTLIIYFAGHGYRTDVKKLYLVARNTRKIDDYILGGIDFDFISNAILKSSAARQKIMILDACHSGIATQGKDNLLTDINVKGTYILASSQGDEVSYFQKNERNTYFTGTLLDILKNGIDNTEEMLALDDLYEYSKNHLAQKNFPQPIYKSELNIPSANFFIAHNPSFSQEKLKSKPTLLMNQGRLEDALYEYRLLLQRYPEDLQLKSEAAECETQVFFTHLVQEADELFFHHRDYNLAAEKYKKALQIKDDIGVKGRISKCVEFMKLNTREDRKAEYSGANEIKDKESLKQEVKPIKKNEQKNEDYLPKKIRDSKEDFNLRKDQQLAPASEKTAWIIIALFWLICAIIFHMWRGPIIDNVKDVFTKITLPFFALEAILIGIRNKKISNYEILIYANGSLFGLFFLAVIFSDRHESDTFAITIMLLGATAYVLILKKIIHTMTIAEFVISCIALLYFPILVFAVIIFSLFAKQWTDDVKGPVGIVTGSLAGIFLIILFYRKWNNERKKLRDPV